VKALTLPLAFLVLCGCCTKPDKIWNVAYLYHSQEQTADALHRVVREKMALRIAAACPHQWEVLGPDRKGCPLCGSIADNICGKWSVVLAGGKWVGPETPWSGYPKCVSGSDDANRNFQ
jgi:hypothetical protein